MSMSGVGNMYNNVDNESYTTITGVQNSTSSYYIYIRGFNFDDVPSDATINSITIKLKARESNVSTSSSYRPCLTNGTSTISGTFGTLSTSVQTLTCDTSLDWNTIKGYGSDFGIRINCRGSSRRKPGIVYVYGAEILVDYTSTTYLIKVNGSWKRVSKTYKKENGQWVEFGYKHDDAQKLVYKGSV